jgi:hypothetical protein
VFRLFARFDVVGPPRDRGRDHPEATAVRVTVWLCAVAACTSETAPSEAERAVELGTGVSRFEPVVDGVEVPLIAGSQGGHHVWISIRAQRLDSNRASVRIASGPADESREQVVTLVNGRFDPPDADGRRAMIGWPEMLPDAGCLVGELLRVDVSVDVGGQYTTDEREILVGAGDSPPPCSR